MRRAALAALALGGSGLLLAACGGTPQPPPSIVSEASPPFDGNPPTIAPATLGGYRWTPVDPVQFGGVGLEAVTSTADHGLLAAGDWLLTAEAPDGTSRHPTVWSSTDGAIWSRLPDSPAFGSHRNGWDEVVLDIVPSGSGFVAVGIEQQNDSSNADAAAWISPDGTTWTRATVRDGIGRTMEQVLATDGGFVAIGEARYDFHAGFGAGTAIWTSSDGRKWTRIPDKEGPPPGTRLGGVVAGTGEFLASATSEVGQGAEDKNPRRPLIDGIWRSTDAIQWEPIPGSPLGAGGLVRLTDGFAAIGSSNTGGGVSHPLAWRSTDGHAWIEVVLPRPAAVPTGTSIYGTRLASGAAGLLAFGARDDDFSTVGWSSSDGAAWALLDPTAILHGATIDRSYTANGSILLLGDRSTASAIEPVAWLLAP
jgi:hypothetical protein